MKRGLVAEGVDPLQAAADRLNADGVDVLHTIGGDDTNTTAADLAAFLARHDYALTVVGLPKTIDNDIIPIRQSLGAWTAAEQGARFAAEHHRRAQLRLTDADRARGDGPALRLADRRHRAGRIASGWTPGVAAGDRAGPARPGTSTACTSPRRSST